MCSKPAPRWSTGQKHTAYHYHCKKIIMVIISHFFYLLLLLLLLISILWPFIQALFGWFNISSFKINSSISKYICAASQKARVGPLTKTCSYNFFFFLNKIIIVVVIIIIFYYYNTLDITVYCVAWKVSWHISAIFPTHVLTRTEKETWHLVLWTRQNFKWGQMSPKKSTENHFEGFQFLTSYLFILQNFYIRFLFYFF